jgi:hypothetical protein
MSSDMIQAMFETRMTSMVILDLVVAAAIVLAHRWFLASERRINARLYRSND